MNVTQELKLEARRLGFDRVGVCPAVTAQGFHRLLEWLQRGYAGDMNYLQTRVHAYEHPQHVQPGVRSLVMLAMNYHSERPATLADGASRVSTYAWGTADYHDLIHARLKSLVKWLEHHLPNSRSRGVVDTAPLMEREFAQLAGLGWVGKHTLLINPQLGSWFFLAAVLTDAELEYDEPFETDHCGTCRACLEACPTDAFPEAYVLDAQRCLSYLTIELRDMIPIPQRGAIDEWIFGCDVCQQVCPWNHRAPQTTIGEFRPRDDFNPLKLANLFWLDDEQFRTIFRRTPLWRTKRRGLLRNAAIALGNQQDPTCFAALTRGLSDDEPLVRASCVWALQQFDHTCARDLLQQHQPRESDPQVLAELARCST